MFLSIIILPLLGSIVSGFFGRKVGVSGAQLITCLSVITTTILAILAFFEVGFNNIPVTINLFRWIDSEWYNIIWGFQFDSLTVSMLIPVLIISSLVHLYSISYMSSDPHNQRFFSYLSLFTFMMIILVTANNYLLMFVGWEGVGVCSYLLVSFWFTRIAANQSSISAFLTNRVGDCFLTIGMFAILWSLGNLDYSTVFSLAPYINSKVILIIGICLLIGAMAKSSQVGLHVWLPMAMEGPTPVSALIHAATMVTAGVYLLMRSSPLIEYNSTILLICLWLGAITTVFSSLVGLFQQDIKKVIAYSTMSQLGMMVIAVGLSSYNVALFHLINHAFYKGLLFLGAGAVIHAVGDNQDFRKYGGLIKFLPLTYSVILIASLSLVAFPFMTGFYSKDFILESAYGQFSFSGVAVYIIATIGAIFTTLYSVKVLYLTFIANPNGSINSYKHAHEGDLFLSLPLVILALFSIFFGYITKDIFIGLGSGFFIDNSLFIHPMNEIMINTEFAVPRLFKLLPFIFTILFSIIALVLSEFLPKLVLNFKLSRLGYNIFGFFNQRFLVELFYNKYITSLVLDLGGQLTKILDKGSIELLGPFGLERGLVKLSKNVGYLSTSLVTTYALYILTGFITYLLNNYVGFNDSLLLLLTLLSLVSFFLLWAKEGGSESKGVTLMKERKSTPVVGIINSMGGHHQQSSLIISGLRPSCFVKDLFLTSLYRKSFSTTSSLLVDNKDNDDNVSTSGDSSDDYSSDDGSSSSSDNKGSGVIKPHVLEKLTEDLNNADIMSFIKEEYSTIDKLKEGIKETNQELKNQDLSAEDRELLARMNNVLKYELLEKHPDDSSSSSCDESASETSGEEEELEEPQGDNKGKNVDDDDDDQNDNNSSSSSDVGSSSAAGGFGGGGDLGGNQPGGNGGGPDTGTSLKQSITLLLIHLGAIIEQLVEVILYL